MKKMSRYTVFIATFCLSTAIFVSAEEKIDINTASLEDLTKIVHIGEIRAQELISLRPFASVDDLTRIKGIGEARIKDIKKQGLAWINPLSVKGDVEGVMLEAGPPTLKPSAPELKPQTDNNQEKTKRSTPLKELAAVGEQIPQTKNVSTAILLISFFLAACSGAIILILKRKLK